MTAEHRMQHVPTGPDASSGPPRRGDAGAPPAFRRPSTGPRMRIWYRFCRALCHAAFLTFFRGRVFGARNVPRTGGVILVCNHQSFLDPVLATLALPRECHYMARDTLFANRLFRRLIESLNAFPVKRGAADVGAIKETMRRLRDGALVTIFPEGTRTPDGSIQPMQPGVVLIARKAGVPLVPTLILGAFEAWPRDAKLPRPHPVLVAYGDPLWPDDIGRSSEQACIETLRGRILAMQERFRRHPLVAENVWLRQDRISSGLVPPARAADNALINTNSGGRTRHPGEALAE